MMTPSPSATNILIMEMFLLLSIVITGLRAQSAQASNISYMQLGDITLGGLFPLHLYNESAQECGALRGLDALKRVEAMAYTVRVINANATLLPNITLGYEIYDTCSYNAMALRQSLKMIPVQRQNSACASTTTSDPMPKISGVVGAQRSASSLQAAILLGLYTIPQVSYLSTSDELSNNDRYPYFLRTVPPDRFQVNAMVDILLTYKWKYVSFINSDDTYGKSAQSQFRSRAAEHDICLAVVRTIPASVDTYDEVIEDLLSTQSDSAHSTVVILFVQLETAKHIFSAAAAAGAYRRFIWIGSDGWGNYGLLPVHHNEEVALGAFTVVPLSGQLQEYNEYLKTIHTANSSNPWLDDFLQSYGQCKTNTTVNGTQVCDSWTLEDVPQVDEPAHETIVMDSVLAFAYGLHNMQVKLCGNASEGMCDAMRKSDGTDLRNFLLDVQFESPVNGRVEFLDNGDIGGRYGIRNLQVDDDGSYAFLDVGTWVDSGGGDRLMIDAEIPWYLTGNSTLWNEETNVPRSVCSVPCEIGEKRTVLPENPCCWSCTPCQVSEIVSNNGTTCVSCIVEEDEMYAWPNDGRLMCIDLEPDVSRAWTTAIIVVSLFGLLGTVLTFSVYVHNRDKPLIKASSRELCYIIFSGLFLAFFTAMLYGIQPSAGVCALRRLGSPVALSLIYVSIATKTIRVYRIFRAGLKSAKRPQYISPSSQVTLTLVICILPVVWMIVWFIIIPPAVAISMPDRDEPKIELTCDESNVEVIGALSWEIFLIVICCLFAFLTRKLPENYNESRFITFCVFSSLVVFASFAPAFFTTREAIYKATYNALGLFINATVTLMCLFVVKIYALYFVDERELHILTQSRIRSGTRTNSMTNAPMTIATSEGSSQPSTGHNTVGPHVNKAFDASDATADKRDKSDVLTISAHNQNNNNQHGPLPPIKLNSTPGQNATDDVEKGLARGRNSRDGSRPGSTSGSLMTRLRGNSVGVAEDASQVPVEGSERPTEQPNATSGKRSSFSTRTVRSVSEDSSGSQGDDLKVLVKVKKHKRGTIS